MMKTIKTSKTVPVGELAGTSLDWAVAKCDSIEVEYIDDGRTRCLLRLSPFTILYSPSTNWTQGGSIIERDGISLRPHDHHVHKWSAEHPLGSAKSRLSSFSTGPSPLVAAMRCYMTGKLGDSIEIPEEII